MQARAGRALVNWTKKQLAEHTGLSVVTIAEIEAERGNPTMRTMERIAEALRDAGVVFVSGDDTGVGMGVVRGPERVRVGPRGSLPLPCHT